MKMALWRKVTVTRNNALEPPRGIEPRTYALRGPSGPHAASRDEFLTRRDALDGARHLWLVNSILRTPCGPVRVL